MITGYEPAMPIHPNSTIELASGLTIRQHFAAMFMQGCLASGFQTSMDMHAESAVEAADALIHELNRTA